VFDTFKEQVLVAPAKLNLRLKVVGRRADGYHLLSMLNVTTSLADRVAVTLRSAPGISVVVDPPDVVSGAVSDNSVVRVWDEFWRDFSPSGAPCGATVTITKRIPVGGGLGGGSSDAAAMLRFLAGNFGSELSQQLDISSQEFDTRLGRVALRVGADVPYAYCGGACWVRGIGEDVHPISGKVSWPGEILIAMPATSVPTVDFYRFFRDQHPDLSGSCDAPLQRFVSLEEPRVTLEQLIENDFEQDIVTFRPQVGAALSVARRHFPYTTSVTGSGAAIFSLVSTGELDAIPACQEALEQIGGTVYRAKLVEPCS
jgi:4-diphosphocytidyl-2-C-methyl-D-erythritol kinase